MYKKNIKSNTLQMINRNIAKINMKIVLVKQLKITMDLYHKIPNSI